MWKAVLLSFAVAVSGSVAARAPSTGSASIPAILISCDDDGPGQVAVSGADAITEGETPRTPVGAAFSWDKVKVNIGETYFVSSYACKGCTPASTSACQPRYLVTWVEAELVEEELTVWKWRITGLNVKLWCTSCP